MKDSKTASYLYEKYKEYKFHKKIKGYDFLMITNKKYTQTLIGVVAVHSKTAEEKEKSINFINLEYRWHDKIVLKDINYDLVLQDFQLDAKTHFKEVHQSRGNITFTFLEVDFLFFIVKK